MIPALIKIFAIADYSVPAIEDYMLKMLGPKLPGAQYLDILGMVNLSMLDRQHRENVGLDSLCKCRRKISMRSKGVLSTILGGGYRARGTMLRPQPMVNV